MSLIQVLKKDFWDFDKIILKRFKSSKLIFVGFTGLFFTNYFLASNFPKQNFLIDILPYTYLSFIIGLLLITYYWIKIKFKTKINFILSIVISIFLIIIWIIFSIPFFIDTKIFN